MIGAGKRVLLKGRDRTYFIQTGHGTYSTDKGVIDLEDRMAASHGSVR